MSLVFFSIDMSVPTVYAWTENLFETLLEYSDVLESLVCSSM